MKSAESPRKRRVLKGVLERVGMTEGEMARDLLNGLSGSSHSG